MGFLAPWFLGGLFALGLPIYIHLLRRHTAIPRPVSSLMFFERGIQSSTKHRRLRYLILFSLRAALVSLLVLAFANPFLRRANAGASGRLMLIAVDNSFSMRAGTRFADGKQAALQLLASKTPSQRAEVIVLNSQLQILTQPVQDSRVLRSAIEGIQPSDSHGNFGELGRGIRVLGETVHTPIDLHLFSDMKKADMPANFADMVFPANVTLFLHPVVTISSQSSTPNWTVASVDAPAQLADPKDQKRSHVEAVIAGYGTPAATRAVSLVVNGKTIATRKIELAANGRSTVDFHPLDVPYGFSRCEIRIDSADGFPADDVSVFTVKRSDPERVLFVHQAGDLRSPLYFGNALAAADETFFALQAVNAEQSTDVDPSKYAFVVLSDALMLPSIFENALAQYVRKGGSVLIAVGTSGRHHAKVPAFGENVVDVHDYSRNGDLTGVGQADLTHPAMQQATGQMTGKDVTGWSNIKIYYAAQIDATRSRVVARLTDGTPLLMDKQIGEGHVLLLASGLDNLTNDLPLHPVFVSFVDQASRYLSGSDRLSGSRLVDSFVQVRAATSQAAMQYAGVEVIDPDGRRPLSLSEARAIHSYQLKHAGFYQIRFANGKDAVIGVNPDRRESDLTPIPQDILGLWKGTSGSLATQSESVVSTQQKNERYGLWWYVMILALAVAAAESIVASYHLGTQREEV
jgi:Aerotolerance regulator N-terminal/von Willebrand factor type A domain